MDIITEIYNNYLVALLPAITAVIGVIGIIVKVSSLIKESKTSSSKLFNEVSDIIGTSNTMSSGYFSSINESLEALKRDIDSIQADKEAELLTIVKAQDTQLKDLSNSYKQLANEIIILTETIEGLQDDKDIEIMD